MTINKNNKQLFDLEEYVKTKRNFFNNEDKCLKMKKKYFQTNPKSKLYNQMYFTVYDYADFNKYGFLNFMYYISLSFSKKDNKNNNKSKKDNKSKNVNKLKNGNKKNDLIKLYENIDYNSVKNSFEYIFYKFKKGVFVIIEDNKLRAYLPLSNAKYENDFIKQTYLNEEEKKLLNNNEDIGKIKKILDKNLYDFMKKHGMRLNTNRKKWVANNCWFRNQYEGDQNYNTFKAFLLKLVKERTIPDCCFYINLRDFPILNKDLSHPFNHLYDDKSINIGEYKKMCPIFSQSVKDENGDLLLPTNDDIIRITGKYFTDKCDSQYLKDELINRDWKKKKEIAIFRGGATGCGITIENNPRLKIAYLSVQNRDILDAGITDFNAKAKKYSGRPLEVIDLKKMELMGIVKSEGINNSQKSEYKYIINVDGSVSAFRLGYELSMNSVILKVESEYKMWYSDLLRPYKEYIPIKSDCSDLIEKIKWCKENDRECKKIAGNAMKFYDKYLSNEGILNYMQNMLIKIGENMSKENILDLPVLNKKKIAIIACFRDSVDGSRGVQLRSYIKIAKHLYNGIYDYDFYIITQNDDGELFNIGKLKNIGFEIASKKGGYYNYIFTDIDMIPDHDLMPYFVKKPKTLMSLAYRGTRYNTGENKKPFLGGLISVNEKIFKKMNGYPNNYYGWGGEDDSLFIRMVGAKIYNLYIPSVGDVIDTEEYLTVKNKTNKLKKEDAKENMKLEKYLYDIKHWKKNGLNSLNYKILKEKNIERNIYQITVDLLKREDSKELHPDGSNIKNFNKFKKNTNQYLREEIYSKIKQIIYK
jgi:hypothetical protein